jgi:hypothetical protein
MFECLLDRLTRIALLALVLYAPGALAHHDQEDKPTFSFSGFGTLGVVHSSERQADFTSSILKPNGAGYSHAWSADVDSLVGGQVTANFTPQLSAVLQVIAEQKYDNTYRPHVEWAYIGYQITPCFAFRVGRTVLPTFLYSGTRKVAYTYPWVRPPMEVYSWVPITSSDGVDFRCSTHIGDFTHTVQANYGPRSEPSLPQGGTIKAEHAWGITYTVDYHAATMHLAYQRTTLTMDSVKPIFDGFRQFGPQGISIADQYDADKKPLSIIAAGASYDPGTWFVTAEWVRMETHSFLGTGTGWYVSGGPRFGKFTPYLTYAQATADNLSDPGLNLATLPSPILVGQAAGLNAALNVLLGGKTVQDTVSVGGRWELTRSTAFKLQYDHTSIGMGSTGEFINVQPGFQPGGRVNVFSAAIDFVF